MDEYEYNSQEIKQIKERYKQLLIGSKLFLSTSKKYNSIDQFSKILIFLLGLITSFISAISGIDDTSKVYITSSFTLLSSIIAGIVTIKKYGQESGKYYAAYGEYKELSGMLNNILTSFKSEHKYSQLNNMITQKEKKFEQMLPRNKKQEEYENKLLEELDIIIDSELSKREDIKNKEKKEKEEEQVLGRCKQFLEKKRLLFLYESMCEYYLKYVKEQKEKDEPIMTSFYQLEQYLRQHLPEKWKEWIKCSELYQHVQLSIYYKNYNKSDRDRKSVV